jgi:putative oxidoreductase
MPPLMSMGGAAGVIETVAGALIMVGFLTRYAAFLASGEMAVAYFMIHQPNGPLPVVNGGQLSAMFCWAFLYIASRGAGRMSVDGALGTKS